VIKTPVSEWRNHLKNEFEDVVFEQYPQIADIKKKLYDNGALYASMSGSGSAIYGLFEDPPQSKVNSNFRQFTAGYRFRYSMMK
jgi:4-diphosphocytidyl-2-C-methyl-D-erythritol kinase